MPVGAALAASAATAGASIYGANQSSKAAKQERQLQQQNFETIRGDMAPFRALGTQGATALSDPSKSFEASPGYAFRLKQGMDGVAGNAAVNGLLNSGSALKALSDYNQNAATSEYNNWWNQQMGLVNAGQASAAQTAMAGTNNANAQGQAIGMNAANQGAAAMSMANAIGSGLGAIADPTVRNASSYRT